jgi:hypothetical protein
MRDVVTPHFHKRRRQGEVILNPKTIIEWKRAETPVTCRGAGTTSYGYCTHATGVLSQHYMPTSVSLPSSLDACENYIDAYADLDVAVAQAWANVDVSSAAALASLGELPETVEWIKSLLTRALKILRFFKSKKSRLRIIKRSLKGLNTGKVLDTFSDLWLELRYALRPTIFEMKQAIEAAKSIVKKNSRHTARGWHKESSNSIDDFVGYHDTAITTYHRSVSQSSLNYRAGVLYDIDSDINGILAIWGLDQPLEAIWELTPFSFIIDWFFSVGDIIAGWSVNPSLSPLGSWVTLEWQTSISVSTTNVELGGTLYSDEASWSPGAYYEQSLMSRRIISPERPILPSFNLKLDWAKLLDLATIGRGLYRSFLVA